MVAAPQPLVVNDSSHWLWAGTGLTDGDPLADLVAGRVDGIDAKAARPRRQAVLARSPFRIAGTTTEAGQATTVSELPAGGFVFAAGTEGWSLGLTGDERIQRATLNVLTRLAAGAGRARLLRRS